MKNSMLLPYRFKKIGWAIFIPTLLLGIVVAFQGFDTTGLPQNLETWLNNLLIIGILCGSLFITCSREKIEDEMIARIRLEALLFALYANTAVIVISTFTTNGLAFVDVMVYNLFTLPLLFLVILRYRLWRLKKTIRNEE